MSERIRDYKDLKIWQIGIEIVKEIYLITKEFPKEELYGLTSQIRRSAVSIPSNIAEGFARYHNKEYKQFLYVSLGSCAEVETQLILAKEIKYINDAQFNNVIQKVICVARMTTSLIKKITSD